MTVQAAPADLALRLEGVRSGYGDEDIVRGVDLHVERGRFVTILGPNGSGKSTLLKTILGLVRPRGGSIRFHDRDGREHELAGLAPHRMVRLGIGYVPQIENVFADMSVRENLEIGGFAVRGRFAERLETVVGLFPRVGERMSQRAGTLSGGERQMVALARALIADPSLLVLDEPSAGLAPRVVDEVFEQVRLVNRQGISVLIVEQKARQSLAYSDYAYVLDMGVNRHEGPADRLLHDQEVVDLYLGGRGRLAAARESSGAPPASEA